MFSVWETQNAIEAIVAFKKASHVLGLPIHEVKHGLLAKKGSDQALRKDVM